MTSADRHDFHPTLLREYDARGIVGDTLTEADAYWLGRTFGSRVRAEGGSKVATGYDGRHSSPAMEEAVSKGLSDAGLHVLRIGLGPTPMLYYAVNELDADGGVQITGSHNPPDYNGFKFMLGTGPFYGDDIRALGTSAAAGDVTSGAGTRENVDVEDDYVERLLNDAPDADFHIGWDCGNGAAGRVLEKLVAKLPGQHELLYTEIDGDFPNHHPDPTEEKNLADLRQLIDDKDLDFGIAFDGDGDRIGAVDGKGRVVWGDQLLMILAEDVLRDEPGSTIIADVKASQALFDHVAQQGGKPLMWKTGHSLVKAKMKEVGSPLAGEMSGHIFFKHRYYGFDDALYAAVRLMRALKRSGMSLTDLRGAMPALINTPELRFEVPEERKFAIIEEVRQRLQDEGADMSEIDGVRVNTEDGWWLLRASNTQNVLVARAEAKSEDALVRLKAMINEQLEASGIDKLPE
ncbi:phosphomannomutase [Pacificimonas flava]|uniref:Phosphomannomutase n=2 Tax=Pacificimonas TaxID=1960290 RepID=A0A219B588_9SPHN|nr:MULTISPECIES: phosphomannomutase/phosphoglucomutase [Pacificimonas]MBZ6379539.1 phosphomannomutase/phosphoglucomutase [Pacificimonas aurantium]OWV33276.1 phosphomannomutase [Pacificimonas flava]